MTLNDSRTYFQKRKSTIRLTEQFLVVETFKQLMSRKRLKTFYADDRLFLKNGSRDGFVNVLVSKGFPLVHRAACLYSRLALAAVLSNPAVHRTSDAQLILPSNQSDWSV